MTFIELCRQINEIEECMSFLYIIQQDYADESEKVKMLQSCIDGLNSYLYYLRFEAEYDR